MTHTSTEQPEALRLADKYEIEGFLQDHRFAQEQWCRQAAAELRRKYARITELEDVADMAIKRIAELESQLSAIGAGGLLAAAPQPPAAAPAQEGWCDGCNPDNCVGCGPAAPAQMQPKQGNSHD